MDNNDKIEAIKEAARLLMAAAPVTSHLELHVHRYGSELAIEVVTVSPNSYQEATDWVRSWGCGVRQKQVQCGTQTKVCGTADGVTFAAIGTGLPPTCRKEEYVERVPKTETKETGEFIEVKRTRVVCGDGVVGDGAVIVEG